MDKAFGRAMDTVKGPVQCTLDGTMTSDGRGGCKLELQDLELVIDGNRVLDRVDLRVREGETLCVLGASGAGKSMLLRTIVRLQRPTGGRVLLDGRPVEELEVGELRRRVNLVQQSPAMLEGTVEANIRFGLELARVPPDEVARRVEEAVHAAALDGTFLDRRADKLSGGERQRVAIARAHALRPEVLLLDEPTAALDPRRTRDVERAVKGLAEDPAFTVVVVTHDVEQARRLGNRTVLMRLGRVVAEGESETLLDTMDPEERAIYMGELEQWQEEHGRGDACE